MADAVIEISVRTRWIRAARLLMRVADAIGSKWLARKAVRVMRIQARFGRGPWEPFLRARIEGEEIVFYEVER